jgi:hypothetical protein
MPVDPIRLQPFFDRVTTASATYDSALRAHAVANRALALNPTSALARARLRAATQAVADARTALDQARRTLDLERLRARRVSTSSTDAVPGSHVLGCSR